MSIDAEHAVGVRAGLLGQLTMEHHTTLRVIEHVPDGKIDYKIDPRMSSFAALANHIYATGLWFADIMETGKPPAGARDAQTPASKAELLSLCEAMNRDFANRVNALSPDALANIIDFPGMGPAPAVTFIGWHLKHLIHHRGQLSLYLRLMGAKVPPIYGPTLDYP